MKIQSIKSTLTQTAAVKKQLPVPSFKAALSKLENSWISVQQRSEKLISNLPSGVRPLVETQLAINELSLKSQMITKAGESVASTLRRIQQFGG